jgi:hypothetical protein
MGSHLIYHPRRSSSVFNGTTVYYDRPGANQDPYVWNDPFLHSYCHMTELVKPVPGDIQLWVSGDVFPNFTILNCDLVFSVGTIHKWNSANAIARSEPFVDSDAAFRDHYRWATQHPFKPPRARFTLKADRTNSFQPQTASGGQIDILPTLHQLGFSTLDLRKQMKKGFASKPFPIDHDIASKLRAYLSAVAAIKLVGHQLQSIRSQISKLPR